MFENYFLPSLRFFLWCKVLTPKMMSEQREGAVQWGSEIVCVLGHYASDLSPHLNGTLYLLKALSCRLFQSYDNGMYIIY